MPLAKSPNLLGRSGWVRKSSTAACYTLSVNFRSEQMSEIGWFAVCNLRFPECNIGPPSATLGCKTRQVRRGPISQPLSGPSGSLSGPSGSPRSPAEPHPPSLAWVETPLPLGPLPPPPGPLNAKHSKRAHGAVYYGTHSPVRSEPSSPPPGSPQRAGGHPAIAPGADLHVRSRRVTTSFVPLELSSELCPSPNLQIS